MTLQFGASLTDDARSVNYDHNTFIIQATGVNCTNMFGNQSRPVFAQVIFETFLATALGNLVRNVSLGAKAYSQSNVGQTEQHLLHHPGACTIKLFTAVIVAVS